MTKKDVIIFLHIYLLGLRGYVKKRVVEDFRETVYKCLQNSFTHYDFCDSLRSCYISNVEDYPIAKGFLDYLSRIKKIAW